MTSRKHPIASGFTLIEAVVAIVLLSVAATVIISLNAQLFRQSNYMSSLQKGTQIQQACVELVLAQRKNQPWGYIFNCSNLNALNTGFTLGVADVAVTQPCPTNLPSNLNLACRQVEISVSGSGISPKPVTLLFVNY